MTRDILDHIERARIKAETEFIKANMIIIDKEIAQTNNLYFAFSPTMVLNEEDKKGLGYAAYNFEMKTIPPMILGMNVLYKENLAKDLGANFIIYRDDNYKDYIELKEENARLRKIEEKYNEILDIIDEEDEEEE